MTLMNENRLDLHPPGRWRQLLERKGFGEVKPRHLCSSRKDLDRLYRKYPDLAGDRTAIGTADSSGRCQSWRDNPGWWKTLLEQEGSR